VAFASATERGSRFSASIPGSSQDSDTEGLDSNAFRRRPQGGRSNAAPTIPTSSEGGERGGSARGASYGNDANSRKGPPKRPLQNFKTLQVRHGMVEEGK